MSFFTNTTGTGLNFSEKTIDGGTVNIGGASGGSGTFTDITVSGNSNLNGEVILGSTTDIKWDRTDYNYLINETLPKTITTGTGNIAVGNGSLKAVTEATDNIAFGKDSLKGVSNIGINNIAIGPSSLQNTPTGAYFEGNISIGSHSGFNNNGSYSTFIGDYAGYENTTGTNTYVGSSAGYAMRGDNNTALGQYAMLGDDTNPALSTGTRNCAYGCQALFSLRSGTSNTSFGTFSGKKITSGNYNLLLADSSATNLTTGSNNVIAGYNSGTSLTTQNNHVIIGSQAGKSLQSGNNGVIIGYNSVPNTQLSDGSTYIGSYIMSGTNAGLYFNSNTSNTMIGYGICSNNIFESAQYCALVGKDINLNASNVNITYCSALGYGTDNKGFNYSTAIGYNSANTASNEIKLGTASETVSCPGNLTFKTITDNTNTTCYIPFSKTTAGTEGSLYVDDTTGPLSYNPSTSTLSCAYTNLSQGIVNPDTTNHLYVWTDRTTRPTGIDSILIGYRAGNVLSTGSSSVMIGTDAGRQASSGNNNVYIGQQVSEGSNSSNCTFVGYRSNQVNTPGAYCTAIGASTSCSTFQSCTAIGYAATCTANNQIRLGTATETVSCPGTLTFKTISDNTAGTYYIPFSKTAAGTEGSLYVDDTTGPLSYDPSISALSCAIYNAPSATANATFANNTSTGQINIGVNASGTTTHNLLSSGAYTGTLNVFGGSVSAFMYVRGNIRTQYGIRTGTSSYTMQADNLGYTVTQATTGWTTALTASTQTNITSVSFTSSTYGTYLFNAIIQTAPGDNTAARQQIIGISTTSGNYGNHIDLEYTIPDVGYPMLKVTRVLNIYADTTVYLVGYVMGTTGTVQTSGSNGIYTYTRIG